MRTKILVALALTVMTSSWAKAESSARSFDLSVSIRAPEGDAAKDSSGGSADKKSKPALKYFLTIIQDGKMNSHTEMKKGESLKPEELSQTIALGSHGDDFKKTIDVPDGSFTGMLFTRADDSQCEGMSESSFKNSQGCLPMASKWHCGDVKISSSARSGKSTCFQESEK